MAVPVFNRFPRRSAAATALALALAASACHKKSADSDAATDPAAGDTTKAGSLALPVVGQPVREGDLVLTVDATGQIQSAATATLEAQASGVVTAVLVHAGDKVTAGEALVRIDSVPLLLDVETAQASVEKAQVDYRNIIEPDSAGTGKAPSDARRQYAMAQSGLTAAQVALDKARLALRNAVVTAPFDGVIESVSVAAGDHVGAGTQVASIVDMTHLVVNARVLEHDIPLVTVGGDAYVTVAARPDHPVRGTIAALLPVVDSTLHLGNALIRVTGDGVLRPGMYVDVRLEATRLHGRVIVPTKAIIERDDRPLVFVDHHNEADWVYINPGRSNGLETEVLPDSGTGLIPLKAGDTVLTEGQLTLTHQAPIRLIATQDTTQQP